MKSILKEGDRVKLVKTVLALEDGVPPKEATLGRTGSVAQVVTQDNLSVHFDNMRGNYSWWMSSKALRKLPSKKETTHES